ncbi:MAG: LamG domain-containing protein [Fibrobacter sp.]|nr:LamG domain-containing protein [Fibrobacter sp.]
MKLASLFLLSIIFGNIISCFGPFNPDDPFQNNINDDPQVTIDSSLVAYYQFDDTKQTLVQDISNTHNDGILQGGAVKTTKGALLSSSISMDGIDDYFYVENNSSLNFGTSDFTISAWVKAAPFNKDDDSTRYDLFSKGEACSTGIQISIYRTKIVGLVGKNSCDNSYQNYSIDTNWHSIVLKRKNNLVTLSIDNKLYQSYDYTGTVTTSTNLFIGKNAMSDSNFFKGLIDEIKIFKRSWSEDEVKKEADRF